MSTKEEFILENVINEDGAPNFCSICGRSSESVCAVVPEDDCYDNAELCMLHELTSNKKPFYICNFCNVGLMNCASGINHIEERSLNRTQLKNCCFICGVGNDLIQWKIGQTETDFTILERIKHQFGFKNEDTRVICMSCRITFLNLFKIYVAFSKTLEKSGQYIKGVEEFQVADQHNVDINKNTYNENIKKGNVTNIPPLRSCLKPNRVRGSKETAKCDSESELKVPKRVRFEDKCLDGNIHGTGGNQINRKSNSENENKMKTCVSDDSKLESKIESIQHNQNVDDKRKTKAPECAENKSENGKNKLDSSSQLFEREKKSSISSDKSSINTLQSDSTCVKLPKIYGTTKHMNLEEGPNQKDDTTLLAKKSQNVISNSTTLKSKGVQTVSSQATKSTSTCSKGKRKKSNFKQDTTLPKCQSFRDRLKQDSSDSNSSCCDSDSYDSQSSHVSQSSLTSCEDSYNYYTPHHNEGKRNTRKSSRKEHNSSRRKCKPNKSTAYHPSCLSCERHNFSEKAVEKCKPRRPKEICSIRYLPNTREGDFVTWLKNVTEVWKDINHFDIKCSCPPTQRSARHVHNDPSFYTDEYTSSEGSEDNKEVTYSKCDNEMNAHKSKKDSKSSKRRSNFNYDSRKHQPLQNAVCHIRQGDYRSKHSSKGFSYFHGDTSDHVAANIKESKSSAQSHRLRHRRNFENISQADDTEDGRYTQDDDQPMLPTNTQVDQNSLLRNPHPKIKQPLHKSTFIHWQKGTPSEKIIIKQDNDTKNETFITNEGIKSTKMKLNNKNRIFEGHINIKSEDYNIQNRDGNDATHDIDIKGKLSGSLQAKMVDPKNQDVNTSSSSDSNDPGHRARKMFEALIKGKTGEGKSKDDEDDTSCDDIIEELSENSQGEAVDPKNQDVNTPSSSDSNDPGYRALIKGKTAEGNDENKDQEDDDTSCDDIIEELSENSQGEKVDPKEDINAPPSPDSSESRLKARKMILAFLKAKSAERDAKNKDEEDDTSCDDIIEELSENSQGETVEPTEDVNAPPLPDSSESRLKALIKGKTAEGNDENKDQEDDDTSCDDIIEELSENSQGEKVDPKEDINAPPSPDSSESRLKARKMILAFLKAKSAERDAKNKDEEDDTSCDDIIEELSENSQGEKVDPKEDINAPPSPDSSESRLKARKMILAFLKAKSAERDAKNKDEEDDTSCDDIIEELSENSQGEKVDPKQDINAPPSPDSSESRLKARKMILAFLKAKSAERDAKNKDEEDDTSCDDIIEELSENSQGETVDPTEDVNAPPSPDSNDSRLKARKIFEALIKGTTGEGNSKNEDEEDDTSCDDIIEELSENSQGETVDPKDDVNIPPSSDSNDPGHRARKIFEALIKGTTGEGNGNNKDEENDTSCDDIIEEVSENSQCETVNPNPLSSDSNDPGLGARKIFEPLIKGKPGEGRGKSKFEENDTNCSMEAERELFEMSEDENTNVNTYIEQKETEDALKDKAQTIIDYLLKEVMKPSEGHKSYDPNIDKLDQKMFNLIKDVDFQTLCNITSLLGDLLNSSNNSVDEVEPRKEGGNHLIPGVPKEEWCNEECSKKPRRLFNFDSQECGFLGNPPKNASLLYEKVFGSLKTDKKFQLGLKSHPDLLEDNFEYLKQTYGTLPSSMESHTTSKYLIDPDKVFSIYNSNKSEPDQTNSGCQSVSSPKSSKLNDSRNGPNKEVLQNSSAASEDSICDAK